MTRGGPWTILLVASSLVLAACGEAPEEGAGQAAPPPAVGIAPVVARDVTPTLELVGRVEAADSVEIEARVTGFLVERAFIEGSNIAAGDLLFRIEPEPFEVAVAARQAELARAEAALLNASQQRDRIEPLVARGAQPEARLDDATAAEAEARALRDAAAAALRQARIDLGYTEIRAPFAGRIGRAAFSEGALVAPGRGALARLVRLDPIEVEIQVPDRAMLDIRRRLDAAGAFEPYLRLGDGSELESPGRFLYFEPLVERTTDTVRVHAEFANPDEVLLPGQFVTVLVRATSARQALVIPEIAVQQDQAGYLVLTLDAENRVQEARVELGDRSGTDWVVLGGLEEGQNVVVEGLQRVRPGMTVQPGAATRPAGG